MRLILAAFRLTVIVAVTSSLIGCTSHTSQEERRLAAAGSQQAEFQEAMNSAQQTMAEAKKADQKAELETSEPVYFKTDPTNNLPIHTVAEIDGIMSSRHGLGKLRGKLLRIRTKVETVDDTSVSVMYSPVNFFYETFVFDGFGDADLDTLKPGDTVEIVCEYYSGHRDDAPGDHYGSMKYLFTGREIHKVQ